MPTTVIGSLSSEAKAHDINPSPTATPRGCSNDEVGLVDDGSLVALEIRTGAGAEFDSKGSRT